ncbi:unnamed protein product [Callosobruchus maculatus]|uniref:G-protein coupled receptors family 1 profile domain-containing protein n=1 Tax=Callosobruchus maculatus TaxID=64391 RepID=A0A653BYQ3_CALMS|nr:unnamed protein product [Callosobruchus maculatus]
MYISIENSPEIEWFEEFRSVSRILYHYVIPIICLAIIPLNLSVVISCAFILRNGKQPTSTYLFLGNIALSDLLTGVSLLFDRLFPLKYKNHYICELELGLYGTAMMTSVYSIGLIGIDRFVYIVHGLQYQMWIYPFRAKMLIMTSWLVGGFLSFLPLMGWHNKNIEGKSCLYINTVPKELVILTTVLGVIPLLMVIVLYSIILRHALKKIVEGRKNWTVASLQEPQTQDSSSSRKHYKSANNTTLQSDNRLIFITPAFPLEPPRYSKAIRVVALTTGCFIVTWFPLILANLIYISECDLDKACRLCMTLRMAISSPLALLGTFNSVLNPLIYAWWHKGFRGFVKQKVKNTLVKKISTISFTHSNSSSS